MIYPNLPWKFFWVVSWIFSKFMRIFHHFESNCSFQTALVRPWCFRAKGWWLDHRQWWDGGDGGDGASPQVGWHVIYQQDIRGCRFVPHFFFAEIYPPQMVKGDLDIIYIYILLLSRVWLWIYNPEILFAIMVQTIGWKQLDIITQL